MTQEEKDLLVKDLCSRLPYDVKVAFFNGDLTYHSEPKTLTGIEYINNLNYSRLKDEDGNTTIVEFVKLYLFPMSSMTKEQKKEWQSLMISGPYGILYHTIYSFDYLYKNHIDIRGLIEKDLAIDATGLNIY